ncbi:MAG: hypothetical protein ACK6BG_15130 [Cyanobacteriota bacterium]
MNINVILICIAILIVVLVYAFVTFPWGSIFSSDSFMQRVKSVSQALTLNLYYTWLKIKIKLDTLLGQQKFRALRFRAWIEYELIQHEKLRTWLLSLSDSGFQAITDGAARYCRDLNISLDWLFGQDLKVAPEVNTTIKMIIIEYLEGCSKAVDGKESIALFSLYEQLVNPNLLRKRIDLRRSLFKKVISLGLVEPIPAYDLIMSSELQRQEIAAAALRDAAKKDWAQFAGALSSILLTAEEQQTT